MQELPVHLLSDVTSYFFCSHGTQFLLISILMLLLLSYGIWDENNSPRNFMIGFE